MEERYLMKEGVISTGIDELDVILNGGFESATSIAILGPVGFEKALFGLHFMSTANTRNFYLTFDMDPKQILQKAKDYGMELKVEKFFDGYSKNAGISEYFQGAIPIDGPTALNDISLELNKILQIIKEHDTSKFFFHSFSSILLYNPVDSAMKFFQVVEGRIKAKKGAMMALFEKGLHQEADLNLIIRGCDYVFDIDKHDGNWLIKSTSLPFNVEFTVGNTGISTL